MGCHHMIALEDPQGTMQVDAHSHGAATELSRGITSVASHVDMAISGE